MQPVETISQDFMVAADFNPQKTPCCSLKFCGAIGPEHGEIAITGEVYCVYWAVSDKPTYQIVGYIPICLIIKSLL